MIKQLTNYRKRLLRVDIVNEEISIATSTEDAPVVAAHGQAEALITIVIGVHFRWRWGPFVIRGFAGRPQQHTTVVTAGYEQGTVV